MVKKGQKKGNAFRNRIVGHGEESPEQLMANPKNWRIHPKHQQDALEAILDEVGWVAEVIINRTTQNMVDGHLRVELGIKRREKTIPVSYVELTEQEEELILATLDPLAGLAVADPGKLDDLIKNAGTDNDTIQDLLEEIGIAAGIEPPPPAFDPETDEVEDFEDVPAELPGAAALKFDMNFKSDAFMNIPELRHDMLAKIPKDMKLASWPGKDLIERGIYEDTPDTYYYWQVGTSPKGLPFDRAFLAFYAEDHKFESIWDVPDVWAGRAINAKLHGMLTPDFSIWWDQPKAYHCYQYYRAMWVGRYMQEAGIPIIPDLKVGPPEDIYPKLQITGIPKNPPALSFQAQTSLRNVPAHIVERRLVSIRNAIDTLEPEVLIVYASRYGRETHEPIVPEGLPVLWLESVMDLRRDHIQSKEGRWK